MRYERERMERLASTLPPPHGELPITDEREFDFEKTPVPPRRRDDTTPLRPVRPLDLDALAKLDPAHEAVVPPTKHDPRAK